MPQQPLAMQAQHDSGNEGQSATKTKIIRNHNLNYTDHEHRNTISHNSNYILPWSPEQFHEPTSGKGASWSRAQYSSDTS